jgi:hypothetical protein
MSRKVFTAGEVLAAADVNNFLMDQTVMSFAGTAARGSAIPSPTEGMITYLEDIDDLRTYNGSSWVSPFGITHINTTTFTNANSVNVNNVFSSEYDTYKIILTASTSSAIDSAFVLRVGGVNATTNYNTVNAQVNQLISANATALNVAGGASANFGRIDSGSLASWDISQPAIAAKTFGVGLSFDGNQFLRVISINHTTATAYDGFSITLNNTTGTVRVYGMRK